MSVVKELITSSKKEVLKINSAKLTVAGTVLVFNQIPF
jgi:hypothetical protein